MANYVRLANAIWVGITTDTKPTNANVPNGDLLYEFATDYSKFTIYVNDGSAWNAQTGFTETGTNKTLTSPTINTPVVGGLRLTDVTKVTGDSPYAVTTTNSVIRADASSGALTITLPTAVGVTGKIYTIKRIDILASSNLVTIATTSSQTIDGAANQYLWNSENITVESDGANWQTVSRNNPDAMFSYLLKGSTPNRRYIACTQGQYAGTPITSTTSPAANTLWAEPFIVPRTTKFDTISFAITTGSTAGNSRVGIYLDSGNCYPGKLYFDSGAVVTTGTGTKDTTITAGLQTFAAGLYWLAYEQDTATGQMICINGSGACDAFMGFSSAMTAPPGIVYSVAHTFGALPDPYTSSATILGASNPTASAPVPAIGLRPI
jgi:hypothetical protein